MKSQLKHLFYLLFIPCAMISCGGGTQTNEEAGETAPGTNSDNTAMAQEEETEKVGPFNIKSGVIEYEDKNLNGDVKAILKLTFDNYGSTVNLVETAGAETSIYIFNDLTKKGVTMFPGRKPNKMFMRQGEINQFVAMRSTSGFTKQEDEAILGKNCEVQANNANNAKGESQLTYWMYEGIVMKEINRLGMGYIFEATKLEEQAMEESVFALPNGTEMPHEIF